jgi:hypothetical protein
MRWSVLLILALSGCSTSPVAGFLDWARPARMPKGDQQTRGGVCNPNPLPSQINQPSVPAPGPGPAPIPGPNPNVPPPPIDPRPPF